MPRNSKLIYDNTSSLSIHTNSMDLHTDTFNTFNAVKKKKIEWRILIFNTSTSTNYKTSKNINKFEGIVHTTDNIFIKLVNAKEKFDTWIRSFYFSYFFFFRKNFIMRHRKSLCDFYSDHSH